MSSSPRKPGRRGARNAPAAAVIAAIVQATGCAQSTAPPAAAASSAATGCQEKQMKDEVLRFRETTNPTLSDHHVGIGRRKELE